MAIRGPISGMRFRCVSLVLVVLLGMVTTTAPVHGQAEWTIDTEPSTMVVEFDRYADSYPPTGLVARFLQGESIVVADKLGSSVRIYDSDGALVRELSIPPYPDGELGSITDVAVISPDTVAIYDFQGFDGRLTYLSPTGDLVTSLMFSGSDGIPSIYLGQSESGSHLLGWLKATQIVPNDLVRDSLRVGRFSGGRLDAVILRAPAMSRRGSPTPFSPHPLGILVGDIVFYVEGLAAEVGAVAVDGGSTRILQVPLEHWTREEAITRLETYLDSYELSRFREALRANPQDVITPAISDLIPGRNGQIWVKQYDPATDSHIVWRERSGGSWLVLDGTGAIVARAQVPDGFQLLDVTEDRVLAARHDGPGRFFAVLPLVRN